MTQVASNLGLMTLRSQMNVDPEELALSLQNFIRTCTDRLGRHGVILGLSGGIDSAVLAALCVRAVGPHNTFALLMPDADSQKDHLQDARDLADALRIHARLIDITPYLKALGVYTIQGPLKSIPFVDKLKASLLRRAYNYYKTTTGRSPFSVSILGLKHNKYALYIRAGFAYVRIKHRLRMTLLYFHADADNLLVAGAANKTESRTGFFVRHGCDDATDIMPLLNLYKTQVRALAAYLDLPARIREKPPSPDLLPGITDEDAIGLPYDTLDLILAGLESGLSPSDLARVLDLDDSDVLYVKDLTEKSEHMRHCYAP